MGRQQPASHNMKSEKKKPQAAGVSTVPLASRRVISHGSKKRVMCLGRGGKDNRLAYQLQPPVSLAHEEHFTLAGLSRCMTGNSDWATAALLWGSGFQFEGSRQEKNLQFNISLEHRKTEKLFNDGQKRTTLCWTLMMDQMFFCFVIFFFSWSLTCELITFGTD